MAKFDSGVWGSKLEFDFRGRELKSWELNYYFIGMAMAHQGYPWGVAVGVTQAWNLSQAMGVNPWGGGGEVTPGIWHALREGFSDELLRQEPPVCP